MIDSLHVEKIVDKFSLKLIFFSPFIMLQCCNKRLQFQNVL